jgi:hypothetical protein
MFTRMHGNQRQGDGASALLRYHLLSQPVCAVPVRTCGANTDFGAAIRRSEANPKA